jgi:hypothetical protein
VHEDFPAALSGSGSAPYVIKGAQLYYCYVGSALYLSELLDINISEFFAKTAAEKLSNQHR